MYIGVEAAYLCCLDNLTILTISLYIYVYVEIRLWSRQIGEPTLMEQSKELITLSMRYTKSSHFRKIFCQQTKSFSKSFFFRILVPPSPPLKSCHEVVLRELWMSWLGPNFARIKPKPAMFQSLDCLSKYLCLRQLLTESWN